jgi:hypothetical protein
MGIVRESEFFHQVRLLQEAGQSVGSLKISDIDAINRLIKTTAAKLAVDKPGSRLLPLLKPIKVRLCLDASRLLNPYLAHWPFQYATVQDAVALIQPGWYMAKIDLEKYFNQLPLHCDDHPLLGAFIRGRSYVSQYAQFGVSSFPAWSNAVMAAVYWILKDMGIKVVFMTDDLFLCAATKAECQALLDTVVAVLRALGLKLQRAKITNPAQQVVFLGILIDSVTMRLSLPVDKIANAQAFLIFLLEEAAISPTPSSPHHTVSFNDLESLLGKLEWQSSVMIAGRARLRRIRACLWRSPQVPRASARVTLSAAALTDLRWWREQGAAPTGPSWVPIWPMSSPRRCRVFSDASGDIGFGLVVDDLVYQGLWDASIKEKSSAYKELIPILFALDKLGSEYSGQVVIITTDNLGNVFSINKGSCQSDDSWEVLFRIFETAAARQIYLIADWVPREHNTFCDLVSKEPWVHTPLRHGTGPLP